MARKEARVAFLVATVEHTIFKCPNRRKQRNKPSKKSGKVASPDTVIEDIILRRGRYETIRIIVFFTFMQYKEKYERSRQTRNEQMDGKKKSFSKTTVFWS